MHPTQCHAGVFSGNEHADPARMQLLLEPVGDLLGQPLLDLRTAREVLDDPGQFGEPQDPLTGQVSNVGDTGEREQMMLAD